MSVNPQLSFIIVNWNGGELLKRCLESIDHHRPGIPFEVVVVDNASTDGSREWLRSRASHASRDGIPMRIIENEENLGFGKANNQGFAVTEGEFLFLLNADAELTAGACEPLIQALKSDKGIGACGPRLLNPDGSLQISVWRNPPTAWATLISGFRLASLLPRRARGELLLAEFWDHDRRRDVPMLGGAAILVRREVIDEVGGFDGRFHMYGEDNEWCLRIRRAGWRLLFVPDAVVVHQGGHGSRQRWTDLEKLRRQTEAHLMFLRLTLSRSGIMSNLWASAALLAIQKQWRKFRNRPWEDIDLVLQLQLRELKAQMRPGRSQAKENLPPA